MLPAIMTGTNVGRGVAADMAIDLALQRNYQPQRFSLTAQSDADPINVIRHYEVADHCVDEGMLSELRSLLKSHQESNYPDPDLAARIAESLGVRYLIFPQITGLSTDNAGRFTFTGLTFIRTGWISMEGTLQIWDATSRGMAWQSSGECSLTAENVVGISPPVQSAMDALFETLIGDFAIGRTASIVSGTLDESDAANPTNLNRNSNVIEATPDASITSTPASTTEDPNERTTEKAAESPDTTTPGSTAGSDGGSS